jgi:hypothetical protein
MVKGLYIGIGCHIDIRNSGSNDMRMAIGINLGIGIGTGLGISLSIGEAAFANTFTSVLAQVW